VTYTERARTAPRRLRIRRTRVAGLLVVIAAITALSLEWRASSPSKASPSHTTTGPIHGPRGERPGRLRETGGAASTGRLGLGEADGAVPDGTTVFDNGVPGVAKLDPALLGPLRRAARVAAGDGVEFVVDSGWRSPAYQDRLLREAISRYGSEAQAARWVATPDTSPHVKGDAVDIGPSAATAWLAAHGSAYGLCQIYANEPWHYELRPEALDHGCPAMYADPTHDPRMEQR
jgi:D-alanyl-D-alanine carboxypeptidase